MLSMMCLPNSVYVNLERLVKIKGELHSQCKKKSCFSSPPFLCIDVVLHCVNGYSVNSKDFLLK